MIESGMSLLHMKTDVTIVSHGRVSLDSVPHDCQRCASGKGTVLEGRGHGAGVGESRDGVRAAAVAELLQRSTGFGSCSREFSQQQRVHASKLRSTTYTRPAARTQSEVASGYRQYVASNDTVLAA